VDNEHMNPRGAARLTRVVADEVVRPLIHHHDSTSTP
jgi:hypothetical protein